MNIHYIYQSFPELSQTFVHDQMRYLKNNGHHISISCKKIRNRYDKLISTDFYHERLVLPSSNLFHMPARLFSLNKNNRKLTEYARQLTLNFSRQGAIPDILIAHFGPNVLQASHVKIEMEKKLNHSIPLVGIFHGYDLSKYIQKHGSQTYLKYQAYIDRFITISDHWNKYLVKIGIPEKRIRTIRLGVDGIENKSQRTNTTQNRILSVGRMVEKKGFDDLITAFSLVKQTKKNIILEIVGDGPELTKCIAQVKSLGLEDSVIFTGALSHSEVIDRISRADLFVLASKTASNGDMEGIPVVLMEAMACGRPVISTLHSGIPELIEQDITGLLVPENSPADLSHAITKLIENPDLAFNLSCNAKATIRKQYNQNTQNALFEAELNTLISH